MSEYGKGVLLGTLLTLIVVDRSGGLLEVSNTHVRSQLVTDESVPAGGYGTALEAVIAASNRYNPDSVRLNREHVGAIIKCPDQGHYFTHGVGEPGRATVTFIVMKPKRCTLAALWHTHGGDAADRQYFSPEDTRAAEAVGRPIYMTNHTGRLYVYRPGQAKLSPARKYKRKYKDGFLLIPGGTAEGTLLRDEAGLLVKIQVESSMAVMVADRRLSDHLLETD